MTVEVPVYVDFCAPNSTLVESADQEPNRPRTVLQAVFGLMVPVTDVGRVTVWPLVIEPILQTDTALFPPVAFRVPTLPCVGAPYAEPVQALDPPWADTLVRFLQA